jgi:hypothetical protein
MRYYSITITNPLTGKVIQPKSLDGSGITSETYTSFANGQNLTSALNVEIQAVVKGYAVPVTGAAWVRIWGISIEEMSQGNNLNGMDIVVRAGMQRGLPLANPAQNGVILQGRIFQAYGNWEGTTQTLDLILIPDVGNKKFPKNFTFNWKKKTALADAIKVTLQAALPSFKTQIAISPQLVLSNDEKAVFLSLPAFARYLSKISNLKQFQGIKPLSGGTWSGITVAQRGNIIVVFDGTKDYSANSYANPKQILFQDLMGQPTWRNPTSIDVRCVMRADINVGDFIRLPEQLASPFVLTSQGQAFPNTPATNALTFKGVFGIKSLYHFGNFRQADGPSWVTSYEAFFITAPPPAIFTPAVQKQITTTVLPPPPPTPPTSAPQTPFTNPFQ